MAPLFITYEYALSNDRDAGREICICSKTWSKMVCRGTFTLKLPHFHWQLLSTEPTSFLSTGGKKKPQLFKLIKLHGNNH